MTAKHRGGRRPWRRRVPGLLVAVLAAAGAVGVAGAALRGTATEAATVGGVGLALTASGGGVKRARRHRGSHRFASPASVAPSESVATAPAEAPSAPELIDVRGSDRPARITSPNGPASIDLRGSVRAHPAGLVLVPTASTAPAPSGMSSDTVPHPVVKLFPLAGPEPDFAAGSIDERVYAAFDAERQQDETSALAAGRHEGAAARRGVNLVPRNGSYRSRHSA